MDGGGGVGGCDKQYSGEVVVHIQIVVVKCCILLRVKYFQQRRRRVSAHVGADDFVHFVEDKDGIGCFRLFHVLDDTSRHGADVGTAMSAYFGFVAQSADRHADIFPSHSIRQRAS